MPTLTQKAQNAANGVTNISVAFPSPVTQGTLLIAIVSNDALAQPPSTVSDTQGNTWTLASSQAGIDNFASIAMYFAIAKASGATTVSWATGGGSGDLMIQIMEYPWTGATLDQHATGGPTVSVTITAAVELAVAAMMDNDGGAGPVAGWSATNGFAIQQNAQVNTSLPIYSGTAVADKTTAVAGVVSTTFSDNRSGAFMGVMAAFKGAAVANPTKLEISLFGTKRYRHSAPAKCSESPPEKPVTLFEEE